jgi:PAS domain S-box-containing protein
MGSTEIIYKLDPEGFFIFANENLAILLGTTIKELYSQSFHVYVREDYLSKVVDHYKTQIKSKEASSYLELPLITTANNEVWIGQTVEIILNNYAIQEFMVVARNITDKVVAEQKYQNIIQNIDLGLLEVDLEERIVYANEPFCKSVGYSKNELLGNIASKILIDEASQFEQNIQKENQKRQEGVSSAYEMKIRKKDGTYIWVLISGAPVKNANGEIIGSIGIHNDITDKKEKEEHRKKLLDRLETGNIELAKQQQYLKAINEFAKKLLDTIGTEAIVVEITTNVSENFNFSDCVVYLVNDEKTHLKQVAAFGNKNSEDGIENPLEMKIGQGIVGNVAATGRAEIIKDTSKDSRYIVDDKVRLSELAVPIIADDEVIGVIDTEHEKINFYTEEHLETLQTIANLAATKIKNTLIREKQIDVSEALLDSEQKMRSLINSALDAVITINEEGLVTEWNHQAVELFKYSKEEAMNQRLSELIIPVELREKHEQGMKHFLKTGDGPVLNQRFEVPGEDKNGRQFPIELSIVAVKMKKKYFFNAFVRDITIKKKAESDMKDALDKQQELNSIKSRFVSTTSHELRTPLTAISSNAEILSYVLENNDVLDKTKLLKNVHRIERNVDRLNQLISNILLIGKLADGKVQFNPKLHDIEETIEKAILPNLTSKNLPKVIITGQKFDVNLDKKLFTQIMNNLIENAFKYSPDSQIPEVHIHYHDNQVELKVKDYGIGVPKEDLERLFETFYRASNVDNIQGTGLGLAIVKEYTELHGGTISVESNVNEGTIFSILLPK